MKKLISGVHAFRRTEYAENRRWYQELASRKQQPVALFITCSDSRVLPHRITQTDPGDLFEIRNAGNIVPPHSSVAGGEEATIEYSLDVLGVQHIIVCGHSQCGAMNAMLQESPLNDLPAARSWFSHAAATKRIVKQKYQDLPFDELWVAATKENVLVQMNHISTHPCVAARLSSGEVSVYGWYYDIGSGSVQQYDKEIGRFVELGIDAVAASPMPILSADNAESAA